MKKQNFLWLGIGILVILAISFFIQFPVESGTNYVTYDSLLGVLILHNPFVFGIYILVAVVLIAKSKKKS